MTIHRRTILFFVSLFAATLTFYTVTFSADEPQMSSDEPSGDESVSVDSGTPPDSSSEGSTESVGQDAPTEGPATDTGTGEQAASSGDTSKPAETSTSTTPSVDTSVPTKVTTPISSPSTPAVTAPAAPVVPKAAPVVTKPVVKPVAAPVKIVKPVKVLLPKPQVYVPYKARTQVKIIPANQQQAAPTQTTAVTAPAQVPPTPATPTTVVAPVQTQTPPVQPAATVQAQPAVARPYHPGTKAPLTPQQAAEQVERQKRYEQMMAEQGRQKQPLSKEEILARQAMQRGLVPIVKKIIKKPIPAIKPAQAVPVAPAAIKPVQPAPPTNVAASAADTTTKK